MTKLRRLLPPALIVIAPMVLMYPLWAAPTAAGEDDLLHYYPVRKLVGRALRAGEMPLNNPLEAGGMALMADPQAAVQLPATWLFALVRPKLAYSLTIFLTFSFAGAGAYVYLRRLGLIRPASTFGALALMFSGFMVGHRVHLAMIQTAALLPWGLWCIELLRTRPGWAFTWLVPIGFATIAAGHWGIGAYMALAWLAYLVARGRPFGRSVLVVLAAGVLAAAIAAPQLVASAEMFAHATRRHIGYAVAGENSFFPLAGVLAVFPFLMGSRTPGVFPQRWWGPWHQSEMLGYVGLATLVLAGAGVWRLYRKRSRPLGPEASRRRDLVRLWTWIAAGAGVWMLGYYLPTYRLVHMVPILGAIRCPARMGLVLEMALAVLASLTIESLAAPAGERAVEARLSRAIRVGGGIVLPGAMIVALVGLAVAAAAVMGFWADAVPLLAGGARDVQEAVSLRNPAVWVPLLMMLATFAALRYWLARPGARAPALVVLLLVDLAVVARFVDMPGADSRRDPERSPAAAWLAQRGPPGSYRVWGIGRRYCDRPTELLLPKAANALGVATLSSYGAWQSPAQAHLFGFNSYGETHNWRRLLRDNALLSLYGVRYILAAEPQFQRVIESVRVPAAPPEPDGANLLTGTWRIELGRMRDGCVRLRSRSLWQVAAATQPVSLRPNTIYRISLDLRGPEGEADHYFGAGVFDEGAFRPDLDRSAPAMRLWPAQIGQDWRHFEYTFRTPGRLPERAALWLYSPGERPVEVRRISLAESHWPAPVLLGRPAIGPGERIYRKRKVLPALRAGDRAVVIYENRLARPVDAGPIMKTATCDEIETLRWRPKAFVGANPLWLPAVGLAGRTALRGYFLALSLPAAGVWLVAAGVLTAARARRAKKRRNDFPQTF